MIDSSQNRVFHYAFLASLALHAPLLLTFDNPDHVRAARFAPPIVARLLEPAAVPTTPSAVNEEQPPPRKKPAVPRVVKPAPAQAEPVPPLEAPATHAPASQTAEAPESLSRDQYRLELIDEARRHKRYPPLARENNWQGDVLVAVVLGANGRPSVTLKGSSGYEVLDRQALEMFSHATRAVAVPPTLRGKEFTLEVRAAYGLTD